MKKWFYFLLLMALIRPCAADTVTPDFLKSLEGRYYTLNRAGLEKFTCDLTIDVDPDFIKTMEGEEMADRVAPFTRGLKYRLVYDLSKPPEVTWVPGDSTGDDNLDEKLGVMSKAMGDTVKSVLQAWMGVAAKDLFNADAAAPYCEAEKSPAGTRVTLKAGETQVAYLFDPAGKLSSLSGNVNGQDLDMNVQYLGGPDGYLLTNMDSTLGEIHVKADVIYLTAQGFHLLKQMNAEVRPNSESAPIGFKAVFSNYQVTPAVKKP